MIWKDFAKADPELAALGEERFERTDLVLLGTLRKNGWPRISPVEFLIFEGHLYLGMMWRSMKALDLLRDPRCTVLNTVSDKDATEGEFKLYGRAVDITDPEQRSRYGQAMSEKIGWNPEDSGDGEESQYHLFAIDIESASFAIIKDGDWERKMWRAK
jgi:hypothetical protein